MSIRQRVLLSPVKSTTEQAMSKLLSALNSPSAQGIFEIVLFAMLFFVAFGIAGLPVHLLTLIPPWLYRDAEDRQPATDIDGFGASEMA